MFSKLYLIFLFVPFSTVSCQCQINEIPGCWSSCEAQCPVAGKLLPPECPPCEAGCVCAPGYIRNPLNGLCIGQNYCALPSDPCTSHEIFSICGASCQPTCSNPYISYTCAACVPGYVCMPGYVRDPITGLCVALESCYSSVICGDQPYQPYIKAAISKLPDIVQYIKKPSPPTAQYNNDNLQNYQNLATPKYSSIPELEFI